MAAAQSISIRSGTPAVLATQAHNLPAARLLIKPRQAANLAITPKRHRGRVAAHHDRTLALGRKQSRRRIPIAVTNPQQVIGRLHREHLLQQLAIGTHRSDAIGTIDAMLK